MNLKNSLVLTGIFGVLLFAVAAKAESIVQVDTSQCVEREVYLVVKSTRNVHYSEKDEGKLISETPVTLKDCGGTVVVDKNKDSVPSTGGRITCPPNVQDCIRP